MAAGPRPGLRARLHPPGRRPGAAPSPPATEPTPSFADGLAVQRVLAAVETSSDDPVLAGDTGMSDYTPTREDKFSFGLWTVGWQGRRRLRSGQSAAAGPRRGDVQARRAGRRRRHVPRRRPGARRQPSARRRSSASARRWPRPAWSSRWSRPTCSPPGLQGGRDHRQRPRGAPLRPGQGAAQHRPGRRAGREDVRDVGRARGRGARRRQGRRRGAGPLPGGAQHRSAATSGSRATTCGSRWSRSPTSRAATSCCRPSGTRSP